MWCNVVDIVSRSLTMFVLLGVDGGCTSVGLLPLGVDGGCTSLTMKVLSVSALLVNGVLYHLFWFSSFFYNFPNPGKTPSGGGEDNLSVTNQCW
jgi:hypothetical protein